MKRRDLVKHLGNLGVASFYAKEAGIPGGTTHTKNRRSAIPRHHEINEFLAKKYAAIWVHPIPSDVQMQPDTPDPMALAGRSLTEDVAHFQINSCERSYYTGYRHI